MTTKQPAPCPRCDGTGMVEVSLGDHQVDFQECSRCWGSGYAEPKKYIVITKVEG